MKKLLAIVLCLTLCIFLCPVYAAEAEPIIILFDDFSDYAEGTVIPTDRWTGHVKNDTTKSSGKAYLEGNNMVCRFSIEKTNTNSGPELTRTIDLTGMEDLTITCRAKQSGGTTCQLNFYTDGKLNVQLASISSTSWTDIKATFKLEEDVWTYTATVGGVTTSGALGEIYDLTNCEVRLKQNITSTKFGYWDDVLITSYTVPTVDTKDESEWFAWTIPDESKAKGTAIDASFLLEKPAGKHGFVKVNGDGYVFENGTPARFWGTNVVFNANNMSHAESDILADRIARSGYNIVRMHMFDASREPNIFASGTTRTFDEEQLDRLFYFTAALKERGIYVYMDLLVYRKAYASDGIVDAEEVDTKGWYPESHYDPYLRFLQKEYAEMLLTRVNPYTGLAYKDDPQMAMIGITNEAGVVSMMRMNLYPQSEYYQNILHTKFNEWVHKKYKSGAELAAAWAQDGKTGLMASESYENNTITFPQEPNSTSLSMARRRDHNEFVTYLEMDFYGEMSDFLKTEVGIKCPCTGTAHGGTGAITANIYANAKVTDYISRNSYYGENASTLFNASHLESMAAARVYGKPFIVTEWCAFEPSPYIAESTLLMSTYAQLQEWDMIQFQMWHENTLPGNQAAINSTFVEYQHPIRTALAPATGQNFLRQEISPLTTEYYYPTDYADATDPTNTGFTMNQDTIIYAKSGWMYDELSPNPAASSDAVLAEIQAKKAGANAANITEQVYWDTNKADFRVETEYTQGVSGFRKTATELDYVTFDMDNNYYTAILNSMTHDKIESSDRMLLSVASYAHNTDREVSGDYSEIVSNGKGPVLVEPVTGTVTLKLDREVEVYALTSSGERKEKLTTVKDENGYTSFTLTSAQQTLNYEICSVGYTGGEASFVIENAERTQSGAEFEIRNSGGVQGSTVVVAVAYNGDTQVEMKLQSLSLAANESEEIAFNPKKEYTKIRVFSIMDFFTMRIGAPQIEI